MLVSGRIISPSKYSVNFALKVANLVLLTCAVFTVLSVKGIAGEFKKPWRDDDHAIVIDAYEKNPIDWMELTKNKHVVGFIGKSSDGLPPSWKCPRGEDIEHTLCRKTFQNYWLKKQLYKTRKLVAKNMGLKWGAYHLGRPGNPIDQANHFIDFTDPQDDELLALDIEHDNPEKWISFEDAEIFAIHIKHRLGRFPVLYTNHLTAKRIAERRAEFPVLSRLPLWYARYRPEIQDVFPMGNWDSYALWQFSAQPNCNDRKCPYRVSGTKSDIDVNVASLSRKKLAAAWPFGELVPEKPLPLAPDEGVLMVSADIADHEPQNVPVAPVLRFNTTLKVPDYKKGGEMPLKVVAVPSPRHTAYESVAIQISIVKAPEVETRHAEANIELEKDQITTGGVNRPDSTFSETLTHTYIASNEQEMYPIPYSIYSAID